MATELNGEEAGTVDRRDLALEAAFTSMSLRERWSELDADETLEPTSFPGAEDKPERSCCFTVSLKKD